MSNTRPGETPIPDTNQELGVDRSSAIPEALQPVKMNRNAKKFLVGSLCAVAAFRLFPSCSSTQENANEYEKYLFRRITNEFNTHRILDDVVIEGRRVYDSPVPGSPSRIAAPGEIVHSPLLMSKTDQGDVYVAYCEKPYEDTPEGATPQEILDSYREFPLLTDFDPKDACWVSAKPDDLTTNVATFVDGGLTPETEFTGFFSGS